MLKRGTIATHTPRIIQHLFAEMKARGVDVAELARRSGISLHTLNKWRRGEHPPSLGNLEIAFAALGLRLAVEPLVDPR